MSKAQPPAQTRKQMVLQQIMLMVTIFLGYQLFFGNRNQPPPQPKTGNYFSDLQKDVAEYRDMSAVTDKNNFEKQIGEQLSQKKITQEAADQQKYQAEMLVGIAQLKSGVQRLANHQTDAMGKLQAAAQTADGIRKQYEQTPQWDRAVFTPDPKNELAGDPRFGSDWKQFTGHSLYDKTVSVLSAQNKKDLILGVFPGYALIDSLVAMTGRIPSFSYGFAAIVLAVLVRAIIWPLAQRQLMWSRQMSQLSPLIKEIKDEYKDNQQEQQIKTMALYKEYGINPMAGCVPAFIQMPLFLIIYQCMLHYKYEFTKGTFLWINPSVSKLAPWLIAPNLGQRDMLLIFFYGITMITSTLLTPVADPSQLKQQRMMGLAIAVFFTILMFTGLYPVPAAFVLYWTCTNLMATIQSLRAYRLPLPPLVKVNAPGGGVYPLAGPITKNGKSNGSMNGHVKTGTPAKHRPKKRK